MKTVAVFDDLPLACIARSRLESAGIPCFLANEHLLGINSFYTGAVQGLDLQVPESAAPEARVLLADFVSPDECVPERRTTGRKFHKKLRAPEYICPKCGGTDIRRFSWRFLPAFLFSCLFQAPSRRPGTPRECRACGHKWRKKTNGRGSVVRRGGIRIKRRAPRLEVKIS
jgi:predicted RNA-binding Zn-ribbon protein involved in translation (DUF1610 family)